MAKKKKSLENTSDKEVSTSIFDSVVKEINEITEEKEDIKDEEKEKEKTEEKLEKPKRVRFKNPDMQIRRRNETKPITNANLTMELYYELLNDGHSEDLFVQD